MSLEPIRRSIVVNRSQSDAFKLFTEGIGTWWPIESHSIAADEAAGVDAVVFEPRVGGRIFEVQSSGEEVPWGRVTSWDPPARVVFDWRPSRSDRPYTEVDVAFSATDDGRTEVVLTHSKWELLGSDVGAEMRESYGPGWDFVFGECFGGAAG
jgi:uncharacterized protein YndB with AHSA1/START domain